MRASRAMTGQALAVGVLSFLCTIGVETSLAGVDATVRQVRATAYALSDDRKIFAVEIEERWDDDRLLSTSETFRSPEGKPIARRTTEFAATGYRPSSQSESVATGETIAVRPLADGVEVEHRKAYDAPLEQAVLHPDEPVVVGSGLARFVRERWDRLSAGETLEFSIVVPRRLDWFRMRVRKEGEVERGGRRLVRLRLEPESFFVRAIVGGFEMQVDPVSRALVASIGSIEIPGGDEGERVDARLVYDGALPGVAPQARR